MNSKAPQNPSDRTNWLIGIIVFGLFGLPLLIRLVDAILGD